MRISENVMSQDDIGEMTEHAEAFGLILPQTMRNI